MMTDSSDIMVVSYLALQVFKYPNLALSSVLFRMPQASTTLSSSSTIWLTPSAFLVCALKHTPEVNFSLEGWELLKVIMDNSKTVLIAMKAFARNHKMLQDEGEE